MPETNSVVAMRNLLDMNHIYIDKELAREQGKAIITGAGKILDGKRGSDWSGSKAGRIQRVIRYNKDQNEATFINQVFNALLGFERTVPVDDIDANRDYIDAAWDKDFLRSKWDTEFVGDGPPKLTIPEGEEKFWKGILALFPRITNPKPDISYSVDSTAYDERLKVKMLLDAARCQLGGRECYHTFFAVECKCINSSIQAAENQDMTDGATMCEQSRRCRRAFKTGNKERSSHSVTEPTPDKENFVFTMAVAPDQAKIYVNWILVHPPAIDTFHMHHLRTYMYNDEDQITALHHDIDNILDWGIGKRKEAFDTLAEECVLKGILPEEPLPGPPNAKRQKTGSGSGS
ncbi:uncharacterized protein KY384_002867 [Bacidia gigantensis]|uniref:uncharacterized protein n=1 Tax=Bacidia gigantensis TaxID=2732470 RepID=UPI001D057C21|nr:uncharacterized protein KY384_002867 [Bacidia gigantensis]KAG8532382.1 hypothetical protein KY384_002867 [Bacidia gigantensis]